METEAYHESEAACHGYRGTTPRAAKLRRPPGTSYVYLSYGIHRLLNVVTGSQDVASAVLVRGVVADDGEEPNALAGPGRVATGLQIELAHDDLDLLAPSSPVRLLPAARSTRGAGSPTLRARASGSPRRSSCRGDSPSMAVRALSRPRPPGWTRPGRGPAARR